MCAVGRYELHCLGAKRGETRPVRISRRKKRHIGIWGIPPGARPTANTHRRAFGGVAVVGAVHEAHEAGRVTKASGSEEEGRGHGPKTATGWPLGQLPNHLRYSRR